MFAISQRQDWQVALQRLPEPWGWPLRCWWTPKKPELWLAKAARIPFHEVWFTNMWYVFWDGRPWVDGLVHTRTVGYSSRYLSEVVPRRSRLRKVLGADYIWAVLVSSTLEPSCKKPLGWHQSHQLKIHYWPCVRLQFVSHIQFIPIIFHLLIGPWVAFPRLSAGVKEVLFGSGVPTFSIRVYPFRALSHPFPILFPCFVPFCWGMHKGGQHGDGVPRRHVSFDQARGRERRQGEWWRMGGWGWRCQSNSS